MSKPRLGRSRPFAGNGYLGTIPNDVWGVLSQAWEEPFHISGNFAREFSIPTAFAASMGWLTNISPAGRSYSRKWHLTPEGQLALRHRDTYPMEPKT